MFNAIAKAKKPVEQDDEDEEHNSTKKSTGKKSIDDDEHIKTDFGYDRLNIRYKTCVKCTKYNAETKKGTKNKCKTTN